MPIFFNNTKRALTLLVNVSQSAKNTSLPIPYKCYKQNISVGADLAYLAVESVAHLLVAKHK